ncbi:hypothetical protein LOTGIDRAFT_172170 [Lottia gigantea]|uniref:Uncharacterized protein n=1 Tax=Lottia gigantea TaxID=225164 RepID=V4CJA1_LOTGI|nr:hypothetical protein LOTGIDRAFT_172170 [Lottia gigantea]ESP02290.1 hypothetical protein LOTGIDRAFT_172170 [Lottia gigantea]
MGHHLFFQYRAVKAALEEEFPNQLEITSEATPNTSGWLEVQIIGGKLLHSKKYRAVKEALEKEFPGQLEFVSRPIIYNIYWYSNGDGYIDSDKKLQKIFDGVREALNSQ